VEKTIERGKIAELESENTYHGVVKNYINGRFVESKSTKSIDTFNPATNKIICKVPYSEPDELNRAVKAAKDAFIEWRETPPNSRAQYMFKLKHLFEENFESLARYVVQENGKTLDEARGSVRRMIDNVEVAAGIPSLMMGYNLEDGAASGIDEEVLRQPLGVFSAITPFNFPAMVPLWFIPSAIATGNTFVLKPSEYTAVTQSRIFEIIDQLDLPPGVVNMVHGGRETAEQILDHPDIKGVSFVGSTTIGKHVYRRAAENGKRVQVQGGAKNAVVVMPDTDLNRTVPNLISSFYGCAGQRCLAGSLLVAVGDVYDELKRKFVEGVSRIKVGCGFDESSQMGAITMRSSMERILELIDSGVKEGAKLLLDGRNVRVDGYPDGNFIGPTVFDEATPGMRIVKEEIFGPVAVIIRVKNLDEAIEFTNSLPFGNAASIYTDSGKHAREFRYRVEAGNIGINVGVAAAMAYFPFGGFKDSFYGDLHGQGRDGIEFFTDKKVVITRWV
jgi:malonate-semialdehyde dehydrogenase (acetylating) / methylmalonate-semialdehyde dehydrogenase